MNDKNPSKQGHPRCPHGDGPLNFKVQSNEAKAPGGGRGGGAACMALARSQMKWWAPQMFVRALGQARGPTTKQVTRAAFKSQHIGSTETHGHHFELNRASAGIQVQAPRLIVDVAKII